MDIFSFQEVTFGRGESGPGEDLSVTQEDVKEGGMCFMFLLQYFALNT